ncbi:MAG: hypothetical protein ABW104_13740 [Candidatus Thiodiazotropha sp. 6PLUC2]|nr:hypothetical protein [Candidatus Thiodiazotropha lotti]MCW4222066.1 hypothetical protein [Candidatus Thiodiazotropha lotti]
MFEKEAMLIISVIIVLVLTGFGGLASLFAMLASIIHFQILGALGYFILMAICWGIFGLIISIMAASSEP